MTGAKEAGTGGSGKTGRRPGRAAAPAAPVAAGRDGGRGGGASTRTPLATSLATSLACRTSENPGGDGDANHRSILVAMSERTATGSSRESNVTPASMLCEETPRAVRLAEPTYAA